MLLRTEARYESSRVSPKVKTTRPLWRDHDAGRVGAVAQERGGSLEQVRVPAVRAEVGAAHNFPPFAGKDAVVALGGGGV